LWVNITAFLVSGVSDYRGKQDMAPLPSMWDRIKALGRISYKPIGADDRRERWGFVAHELQETLTETAATGKKDGADRQALDMASTMTLLAALTGGLREAMTRIEALEAAA
jgi:hypothetical protein